MTAASLLSLIRRAQAGDERAFDILLLEYRGYVHTIANDYYLQGADRDDLWQEAEFGFLKAVRDYDPCAGVLFTTFMALVVRRQVITAVKTAQRQKHQPLTDSARVALTDEGEPFDVIDRLPSSDSTDPYSVVIAREQLAALSERIRTLTPLEHTALVDVSNDFTYGEVAQLFGVDEKAIDNGRQRAKRKLADLLAA